MFFRQGVLWLVNQIPKFFLLIIISSSACGDSLFKLDIPSGFPEPSIPDDNIPTVARVNLGMKLFFDKNISLDSTIACVSCHHPERAFTDGQIKSPGIGSRLGKRNTPSILNAAYLELVNKDGGVKKLDLQAIVPIEDENEMGISLLKVAKRLEQDPDYVKLSIKAYNQPPNPFVITRALASFVRTLYSGNSAYDEYQRGDSAALSSLAQQGKELFESERLNCIKCHSGFNLTNNAFENNGLYEVYKDFGRMLITADSADMGKFRVPSLRNVSVTGPYMHDGSLSTLTEVLEHYEFRSNHPTKGQSKKIKAFVLEEDEKDALLAFLQALTDTVYQANAD